LIRISPWLTALAVVIVLVALGGIALAEDAKPPAEQATPTPAGPVEQAQTDAQKAQEAALQQAEQAQAAALQAAQAPAPVQQAPPVADLQQAQADAQKAQQDALQQAQAALQPSAAAQQPDLQQQPQKAAAVQQPNAAANPNPFLGPAQQPNAAANPLLGPPPPPNMLNSASASDPRFWDPSRSNNFDDWRDRHQDDGINNRESIRNVRSGSANPSVNISNTGDNVNMCLGLQQVANTGNVANQQGLSQYNSDTDDVDFEGSGIDIAPELTVECNQTIIQAAAAGNPLAQAVVQSGAVAAPALASASASAPPVVAAVASGGGAGPSVGLPVARGAGLAQLPSTGGLMTLPLAVLGLSGLGGGLMFWRLRR
jgi:hypothetical protein